ncbi:MAG: glycosyltransferase [Chthoniobacteraceae bacterium]
MKACSVVVTTFRRPDLLRSCLQSVLNQGCDCEIVVVDDDPDRSAREVVESFGAAVTYRATSGRVGPSAGRNLGVETATCPRIIHLDDDSFLPAPGILEAALVDLEPAGVGAVAMPYQNILVDDQVHGRGLNPDAIEPIFAFTACAYAIRRDAFLTVGGYRELLFYMGEESDLCIRLAAAGWMTRRGNGPSVHHLQPAGHFSHASDFYGRRNEVLFEVLNAPLVVLPWALIRVAVHALRFGLQVGRLPVMLQGFAAGIGESLRRVRERRAVPRTIYSEFRRLLRQSPAEPRLTDGASGISSREEPRRTSNQWTGDRRNQPLSNGDEASGIHAALRAPTLSIVIPTFDRAKTVFATVESAIGVNREDAELIVIDDGSTDQTGEAFAEWKARKALPDLRITYHRQPNRGACAARNAGFRMANGDCVLFLDADDRMEPGGVTRLCDFLAANPDVGVAYGVVDVRDTVANGITGSHGKKASGRAGDDVADYLWHTMGAVYRRGVIETVGGWNESLSLGDDWDFGARVRLSGCRYVHCPVKVGEYLQHTGPKITTAAFEKARCTSVVNACLSIESYARTLNRLDPALRKRLWQRMFVHALEFAVHGEPASRDWALGHCRRLGVSGILNRCLNLAVMMPLPMVAYRLLYRLCRH